MEEDDTESDEFRTYLRFLKYDWKEERKNGVVIQNLLTLHNGVLLTMDNVSMSVGHLDQVT